MKTERKKKIEREKKARKPKKNRTQKILILVIVVLVGITVAASIKNIISLELEHSRLEKQNSQLKAQKKELELELKNVNSKEYIEEQARKQLRLVNPDEILFVFPDEDSSQTSSSK